MTMPGYDEIAENLAVLDDWEERYAYVIQIGKALPPLPEELRTEANRVQGCASQVWLATDRGEGRDPVALAIAINSGKKASDVAATDTVAIFDELGLKAHLSSQRSNGLRSMVARIKRDAEAALA